MSDDPGEAYFEFFGKFAITHRMDHDDLDPHFSDQDLLGGYPIDIGTLTNQLGSSFIFKMHDDTIVVGFLANGTSPGKFTIVQDMSFSSDNSFIIDADFKDVVSCLSSSKNGKCLAIGGNFGNLNVYKNSSSGYFIFKQPMIQYLYYF